MAPTLPLPEGFPGRDPYCLILEEAMSRLVTLVGLGCLLLAPAGCQRQAAEPIPATPASPGQPGADDEPVSAQVTPDFTRDIAPLMAKYCVGCHSRTKARGGVVLDELQEATAGRDRPLWKRVAVELRTGSMPPPGRARPIAGELESFHAWLDSSASPAEEAGRATLRRLNKSEYNNTIRDLFDLDLHPADDFPADDVGDGFDNNGNVLSLPPLLLEKYLAAAETVVDAAFRSDAVRRRLLDPPPDDPLLLPYRAIR
jgi:hypothetical protein